MNGIPKWFGHVNLNVRDITRSEQYYADVLGLRPIVRMAPDVDQAGDAFAINDLVRWSGVLMSDDRGVRGPVLDVLQWHPAVEDELIGQPDTGHRWGLNRLLFTAADLDEVAARATAWPQEVREVEILDEDGEAVPALHLRDPDGTHLEVRFDADRPLRFRGVRLNCSSLERSTGFYQRVLRMRIAVDRRTTIDGQAVRRRMLRYEGNRDTFGIELCEPGPEVLLPRALSPGNHPGLYRMALVTEDFAASLEHLADLLPEPPRVAKIDIGAGVGLLDAVFFEDPDGAVVEFIEHGLVEGARRNNRPVPQEI
ncbi:VOC family protein [Nocardioides sp. LHD-245]|uniref:VOC family protein n=1 Tax=Nocardioides sp. LHD-245 TaxID=3051387 RepID=UPI0027DF8AD0|nr:VOC family protein [Nocardioides sp. LHD-245]